MPTFTGPEHKELTGKLSAVLVLLGISVFINYVDRGNLSIAAPMLKDELGISASQLGVLLSAFFWTYACLQPVSGWLVDRLNVNWVIAGGFFLWSAATAATGFVHTFSMLLVLRLILGIGESVAYPSYSKIIALHFPEEHRGLANSVISAGLMLGPGFGMLVGGTLMARVGWRPFFIVLGLVSLLWLVPWIKWMPEARDSNRSDATGAPSLPEFLRLRSAWGTCVGLFCGNYVSYFLITWLPFYLVRERHFSMDTMARIGGTAYLLGACFSTFSGWLSDRWIMAGGTPTRVRKTFAGGGLALAGIFLGLSAFSGPVSCVAMLMLGVSFCGVSQFQCLGNHTDARGAASRGAMDRFPELHWQSCRSCGSGTHRTRPGPNRALLLGFRNTDGRRNDRHNVLGFPGWTGRAGGLAQEDPSCRSLPIAVENRRR